MVNITVIQQIATDEIYGDIMSDLVKDVDVSHENQPQFLPIV